MAKSCTTHHICDCHLQKMNDLEYQVAECKQTIHDLRRESICLRQENIHLRWELDKERQHFPADGIWLVECNAERKSATCMAKLGEIPDPIPFMAIAQHQDAIATAVAQCWLIYQEKGYQAPHSVAAAIVRALHQVLGVRL